MAYHNPKTTESDLYKSLNETTNNFMGSKCRITEKDQKNLITISNESDSKNSFNHLFCQNKPSNRSIYYSNRSTHHENTSLMKIVIEKNQQPLSIR